MARSNEFVGSGSIDRGPEVFAQTDVALDPKQRRLDSRQRALVLADRIGLGAQWELAFGARALSAWTSAPSTAMGCWKRRTRKDAVLPQAALLFKPQQNVSLYASYAKSLAAGGTAPWFADNADEVLCRRPRPTSWKPAPSSNWMACAWARRCSTSARPINSPNSRPMEVLLFVQQGRLHNRGLELSADGASYRATAPFVSVAAIRARAEETDIADYEGHQAINVPKRVPACRPTTACLASMAWRCWQACNTAGASSPTGSAMPACRRTPWPTWVRVTPLHWAAWRPPGV
ncbi:TonB-dependent receptor domain-containing protein [Xanthomonas dyei]|uniref:TonB-dependent receptor domain-containing protein n=1 Tax=Xanthomonas dyei TaxID=743699 RepID=UPI00360FE2C7